MPQFIVPPSELVLIIPGNLNSVHPTEKFIFQQLLPLEAEEREGQLHREICLFGGG